MSWSNFYHNVFNAKLASVSAVFNGLIVLGMNWQHGKLAAFSAGVSQAVASFFATGVTGRLVQHFSPVKNLAKSYLLGSILPAMLTLAISLTAHTINGTQDALLSSMPSVAISFITAFGTNYLTRLGYLRPRNYPTRQP